MPIMMTATTVANLALNNSVQRTYQGTVKTNETSKEICRYFKFTPKDVDKFIVIKWRYRENMFWGSLLGTKLQICNHILKENKDELYGVYKIEWHSDWQKHENNMRYKIKLTPVGSFGAWCPDRSWYTSDMESHINKTYNLFEENPVFEDFNKALEFAIKKNEELYPDTRSEFRKFIDKIFKNN